MVLFFGNITHFSLSMMESRNVGEQQTRTKGTCRCLLNTKHVCPTMSVSVRQDFHMNQSVTKYNGHGGETTWLMLIHYKSVTQNSTELMKTGA